MRSEHFLLLQLHIKSIYSKWRNTNGLFYEVVTANVVSISECCTKGYHSSNMHRQNKTVVIFSIFPQFEIRQALMEQRRSSHSELQAPGCTSSTTDRDKPRSLSLCPTMSTVMLCKTQFMGKKYMCCLT